MGTITKRARDEDDARSDDDTKGKHGGGVEASEKMASSLNMPVAGSSNDYVASLLAQARVTGLLPSSTAPNLQSLGTFIPFFRTK